jgi:hypothetical protein
MRRGEIEIQIETYWKKIKCIEKRERYTGKRESQVFGAKIDWCNTNYLVTEGVCVVL